MNQCPWCDCKDKNKRPKRKDLGVPCNHSFHNKEAIDQDDLKFFNWSNERLLHEFIKTSGYDRCGCFDEKMFRKHENIKDTIMFKMSMA